MIKPQCLIFSMNLEYQAFINPEGKRNSGSRNSNVTFRLLAIVYLLGLPDVDISKM